MDNLKAKTTNGEIKKEVIRDFDAIDVVQNINDGMGNCLTTRQYQFLIEYFQCWHGPTAAKRAGYGGAPPMHLLRLPAVQVELAKIFTANTMGLEEVLARMADQARGIGDFVKFTEDAGIKIDIKGMKKAGKLHLIKGVKETRFGQQIEFYDAQQALLNIGKAAGVFNDQKPLGDEDRPICVKVLKGVSMDDL